LDEITAYLTVQREREKVHATQTKQLLKSSSQDLKFTKTA